MSTWTDYLNATYPVGSIYMSTNSTTPSSLFGGTWTQIKDCFLLAAGDNYKAGKTGGSASVALTANQLPAHRHSVQGVHYNNSGYTSSATHTTYWDSKYNSSEAVISTSSVGSGAAHNNMPPYYVTYMWKRIA